MTLSRIVIVFLLPLPLAFTQSKPSLPAGPGNSAPPAAVTGSGAAPSSSAWGTRTIQLKYLEPEQLRGIFSSRSYVMVVNRELRLLTVTGPASFLDEVEQTGKQFDVAPPPPANIDVTVYLLATPAQAPAGKDLPADLQAFSKAFEPVLPGQSPRLADSETMRVREAQAGEVSFGDTSSATLRLVHISIASAIVTQSAKGDLISLNGLRCWLSKTTGQPGNEADVTANVDVAGNQPVLVAKAGIEKPLALVVRASVTR